MVFFFPVMAAAPAALKKPGLIMHIKVRSNHEHGACRRLGRVTTAQRKAGKRLAAGVPASVRDPWGPTPFTF